MLTRFHRNYLEVRVTDATLLSFFVPILRPNALSPPFTLMVCQHRGGGEGGWLDENGAVIIISSTVGTINAMEAQKFNFDFGISIGLLDS